MYISQPSSHTMTHIPTPMPRLSPSSTTSSVISSTLPSPGDGEVSLGPDVKFPHCDSIDAVTESPPSFPCNYPLPPRDRIVEPSTQRTAPSAQRTAPSAQSGPPHQVGPVTDHTLRSGRIPLKSVLPLAPWAYRLPQPWV